MKEKSILEKQGRGWGVISKTFVSKFAKRTFFMYSYLNGEKVVNYGRLTYDTFIPYGLISAPTC